MRKRNINLFLSLIILFLVGACVQKEERTPTPGEGIEVIKEEEVNKDSLVVSYLALGDSYTIGESVEQKERYPRQLADSLIQKGVNVHITEQT